MIDLVLGKLNIPVLCLSLADQHRMLHVAVLMQDLLEIKGVFSLPSKLQIKRRK